MRESDFNCFDFKEMGVWSVDYIPRGARFGPMLGLQTPEQFTVAPVEATTPSASGNVLRGGANSSDFHLRPTRWKIC